MAQLLADNNYNSVMGIYDGAGGMWGNMITNSQIGGGHCYGQVIWPVVAGRSYMLTFDNCADRAGDRALTLTVNGAARLQFAGIQTNGAAGMMIYGQRDQTYAMQVSGDLHTWTSVDTNYFYLPFLWTDPAPPATGRRFYRLVTIESGTAP